jgi:hypothetical protein
MSELIESSVAQEFDDSYGRQLARVAGALCWVIVVLGAVVAIVASPFAVAFMVSAPSWFWILAGGGTSPTSPTRWPGRCTQMDEMGPHCPTRERQAL